MVVVISLALAGTASANGVKSIYSSNDGNCSAYDVYCNDGTSGRINKCGGVIGWFNVSRNYKEDTLISRVSVNEASRRICNSSYQGGMKSSSSNDDGLESVK